jgi:hypothetical protein
MDAYASEPQYLDHIRPLWLGLAPEERGTFHTSKRLLGYADAHGIEAVQGRPSRKGGLILVAAFSDLQSVKPRPAVLLEHGAGQTYGTDHPSYSGGPERENVVLFLCPNDEVAARNRARYPEAASVAVGAPKMDGWHCRYRGNAIRGQAGDGGPMHRERPSLTHEPEPRSTNPGPVVALSFHWEGRAVSPEARWAFPHYREMLPTLADTYRMLGHGHPRAFDRLQPHYEAAGIETVRSFDEVLARAKVYVCDNSSSLFEFASVGKPVVLLNAPHYRREVEHGLRFWRDARVGVQVDEPEELIEAIDLALSDPLEIRLAREDVCSRVYVQRDGRATERALFAIREVMKCQATHSSHARP